ncbi:MAG: HAD family hydrolase [Sphingobacteriales bacterium]
MTKTALIFDLDNTIYPVSSIADNLFGKLFAVLDEYSGTINLGDSERVSKIKEEMTRRPFQYIADKYELDKDLNDKMVDTLRTMTYDMPMQPFDDYHHLREIPLDKFLVTTGFVKLQMSKVLQLGIEQDFKEIIIVDPDASNKTKKDVFADIMRDHHYSPSDLLVIGDDPDSEITAAIALGIDTFLFDPSGIYADATFTHRSHDLKHVLDILK